MVTPVAPNGAARTYLVFFDWDRADLTDRARQIIAQAAQATTQVQVTRIEVTGNTDTTGTARYNLACRNVALRTSPPNWFASACRGLRSRHRASASAAFW